MQMTKVAIIGAIANILEWYDYSLFGSLAYLIGAKFFAPGDLRENILNAFMVFAVGYLIRPIGGAFFGVVGDKFGRKFALSFAVILMSFPTMLVGLLPSFDQIGIYASMILVIIRMLQGLSMGGVLTGSISFLIEHSPQERRGFVGSITAASICIGILLGSLVTFGAREFLGHVAFDDWGWRVPFLLGGLNIIAGIYIIRYTEETPEYTKETNRPDSQLSIAFKQYAFEMIMSIFINSTGSVLFYFHAVFVINYLKVARGFDESSIHLLSICSLIVMAICSLIAGYLSDLCGRRNILISCIILSSIFSFWIAAGLQYGNIDTVILSQILLAILTALYLGPEPALQAEFYPARIRSTALSISYNTSTSIFGGTAPLIISYLYEATNSLYVFSLYILFTSILSLIGLFFYKKACNFEYNAKL